MVKTAVLDVTQIEPRLKHPTIFDHFDALTEGEAFEILNDHDPKPLYYQLLGERGNFFTWEYQENGPEFWRVRITKPSPTGATAESIGAIAAKDVRKADVFRKLGIDFCCGGKRSLKQAAEKIGMTETELQNELTQAENRSRAQADHDFDKWSLSFLADYISNVHHQYVRDQRSTLLELSDKVAMRHSLEHPELDALAKTMHSFLDDLAEHLKQEEEVLFPIIKQLEKRESTDPQAVNNLIHQLEHDHQDAGEDLALLRTITKDYTLPANACNSYTYLFEKIKEFENDLLQHIHLENNILFPKALALK